MAAEPVVLAITTRSISVWIMAVNPAAAVVFAGRICASSDPGARLIVDCSMMGQCLRLAN